MKCYYYHLARSFSSFVIFINRPGIPNWQFFSFTYDGDPFSYAIASISQVKDFYSDGPVCMGEKRPSSVSYFFFCLFF
jgi:hypothetical protein